MCDNEKKSLLELLKAAMNDNTVEKIIIHIKPNRSKSE